MYILSDSINPVNPPSAGSGRPHARQGRGPAAPGIAPDYAGYAKFLSSFGPEGRYIASPAPLGTNSEVMQPPPFEPLVRVPFDSSTKWELQAAASRILPDWKRINACHKVSIVGDISSISIERHIESGHVHYGNLATCGSVWSCPVCAGKITERRKIDLNAMLQAARVLGFNVYLFTLTAPHNKTDKLQDIGGKLAAARRKMMNRKAWKRLMNGIGFKGSIRALEVTYGLNGWHVHTHEIVFCSGLGFESYQDDVLRLWQSACVDSGLKAPNYHGVDIQSGDANIGEYVAKWGIDCEMTKSMVKRGTGDNYTPFDFLRHYHATGEKQAARLFREYSQYFKGKQQLKYSKGLRDLLNMEQEMTDEELAAEPVKNCEILGFIPLQDWRVIVRHEKRGDVLQAAYLGGWDAVLSFIQDMHGGIDHGEG